MTRSQHPRSIRLGTRGSPLALSQANQIAASLAAATEGAIEAEIVTFTTKGDQLTSERLINSGGKGLFTRELDDALTRGEIDLAVHSLKDVPSRLPDGQVFAAFPAREDPRDGFLSPHQGGLTDLPKGARIGTASLRREAQALAVRSDFEIITFRGSVATRMRKLEEGLADATFLAMAGLNRLGLAHFARPIPLEIMLPAAAQAIIGVVAREDADSDLMTALRAINDTPAEAAATAERALLDILDGSCRTAIAAHLFDEGAHWRLAGEALSPRGDACWRASGTARKTASLNDLKALGLSVGADIRAAAGGALPVFGDTA